MYWTVRRSGLLVYAGHAQTECVELGDVDDLAEWTDVVHWKADNVRAGILPAFQLRPGLIPANQVKNVTLQYSGTRPATPVTGSS